MTGPRSRYQKEGLSWLLQQHNKGVGAILGDEMGLGKTLQTIGEFTPVRHAIIPLDCHCNSGVNSQY